MISRQLLLEIELSAANLYTRLAQRARREGDEDLSQNLFKMASEERGQAQKLEGIKTAGPVSDIRDRWSHYRIKPGVWSRGASLGSREPRISRYLGPKPEDQDWDEVLPKLGSAELLIALYYLVFMEDLKTFKEELTHARFNGVRLKYLLRGVKCLF